MGDQKQTNKQTNKNGTEKLEVESPPHDHPYLSFFLLQVLHLSFVLLFNFHHDDFFFLGVFFVVYEVV